MRVTNQMMTNRMLTNINRNLGLLDKYNTQGATGKKIQVPSDDPIIASRALKFRTILSENEQYLKNTDQASSWLDITESAIKNINSISDKMKELCQQGSTDTVSISDRKKMLTEFSSLVGQLEQELNTSFMGRYIFSGYKTDTKPIIKDDNGNNILNPEIYGPNPPAPPEPPQKPAPSTILGQDITLQVGAGVTTSVNSFCYELYSREDFNNFHELMKAGDYINSTEYDELTDDEKMQFDKTIREQMASMITTIDNYKAKVAVEHTEVGVRMKKTELIQTRLKDDNTSYTDLMSKNENADLGEVIMNYKTSSAAYEASLKIGMNINQMSLADYLR